MWRELVQCAFVRCELLQRRSARRAFARCGELVQGASVTVALLRSPPPVAFDYGADRPSPSAFVMTPCECQLPKVLLPWEGVSRTRL